MSYRSSNRKSGIHLIEARFNCVCKETGKKIAKGTPFYYNYDYKTCYHVESPLGQEYAKLATLQGQGSEGFDLDSMLEEQSENWSRNN